MRYQLYAQGPDNRSTYAECWGQTATSPGRLVAEADRLAELVAVADKIGHVNWTVRDTHRRETMTPSEFWRRPAVVRKITSSTKE